MKINKQELYRFLSKDNSNEIDTNKIIAFIHDKEDVHFTILESNTQNIPELDTFSKESDSSKCMKDEFLEPSEDIINDFLEPSKDKLNSIDEFGNSTISVEELSATVGCSTNFAENYLRYHCSGTKDELIENCKYLYDSRVTEIDRLIEKGLIKDKRYADVLLGQISYADYLKENPLVLRRQRRNILVNNMIGYNRGRSLTRKRTNATFRNYFCGFSGLNDYIFNSKVKTGSRESYLQNATMYIQKGCSMIDDILDCHLTVDLNLAENELALYKLLKFLYAYNVSANHLAFAVLRSYHVHANVNRVSIRTLVGEFRKDILYSVFKDLFKSCLVKDKDISTYIKQLFDVLISYVSEDKLMYVLVDPAYDHRMRLKKLSRYRNILNTRRVGNSKNGKFESTCLILSDMFNISADNLNALYSALNNEIENCIREISSFNIGKY